MESYSVLMSVYHKDSPEELKQSIESMLAQTVPCEQFVIVEDGPLGEALSAVIDGYEADDEGLFTVVRLPENRGLGKALDEGLKVCRNELVARMDADDISLPTRCERLLKLYEENPKLGLAGTNIDEFYDDPANIVSSREVPSDYKSICKFMRRRSPFNHPTVMFKKSEVLRVGGYGKMRRKQDLDLFARMINQDVYALNIDESLLLFRSNEGNYKRRKSWEYCKSYIEVERANYKRGYCSLWDLIVVTVGQVVMHFAPMKLMKFLSDKFLRKKKNTKKTDKKTDKK
jgi:Glycosyltransferases, probably involved in cell wall biogenesis